MNKYRAMIEVFLDLEAEDEHQAREDAAVALIHMIRNDEVAINLWPVGSVDQRAAAPSESKESK